MARFVVVVLLLLATGAGRAHAEGTDLPLNLLAFSNGALVERSAPSYDGTWNSLWLLDENPATGWANQLSAKPPFEFVLSLPEQSRFTRFGFDTAGAESAERSAREIDVFVSNQSATAGFVKVMSVTLQPQADGQEFDVPPGTDATGRWVRLVLKSNNGDDKYWELMEVRGTGVQVTTTPLPNVSGTYDGGRFGKFHLAQAGAQLTGCYEYKEGLVQGGLESSLMRLTWSESGGASGGPAVMVAARNGQGFVGWWRNEADSGWIPDWDLHKISSDVGSCPHWRPAGSGARAGGLMADILKQQGRIRLYGINFDTDSDRLRPDAAPALDLLAAALKDNPAWHVTVEGHTDSTSTAAHNLDLSARRAAAVKARLAQAGIAADRLRTQGFGQDKPISDNATALGRSANRRVEVVRE